MESQRDSRTLWFRLPLRVSLTCLPESPKTETASIHCRRKVISVRKKQREHCPLSSNTRAEASMSSQLGVARSTKENLATPCFSTTRIDKAQPLLVHSLLWLSKYPIHPLKKVLSSFLLMCACSSPFMSAFFFQHLLFFDVINDLSFLHVSLCARLHLLAHPKRIFNNMVDSIIDVFVFDDP